MLAASRCIFQCCVFRSFSITRPTSLFRWLGHGFMLTNKFMCGVRHREKSPRTLRHSEIDTGIFAVKVLRSFPSPVWQRS